MPKHGTLELRVTPRRDDLGKAPYFTEHVRRILEQEDEALDLNIYRDGLIIYTTLDSRLQTAAENACHANSGGEPRETQQPSFQRPG
jgi:penicillin-binding protein 1A